MTDDEVLPTTDNVIKILNSLSLIGIIYELIIAGDLSWIYHISYCFHCAAVVHRAIHKTRSFHCTWLCVCVYKYNISKQGKNILGDFHFPSYAKRCAAFTYIFHTIIFSCYQVAVQKQKTHSVAVRYLWLFSLKHPFL